MSRFQKKEIQTDSYLDSIERETNIRNKHVSVFSRSDGVNLSCGAEQSHERNAIESRQSRNPRGGCKIRIVALSRIMKHSTRYVTLSEREIKDPFQLVRAFGSPAQLPTRTNVGNQEKSIALLVTPKSKDVGYLLSPPLFRTAGRKLTRINACPLCRWEMLRGRANGCSRSYRSFVRSLFRKGATILDESFYFLIEAFAWFPFC